MSFPVTLALGAFLLAVWVDARFEDRRPSTPRRRAVHIAVSCILLQSASIGAGLLVPDNAGAASQLAVVFVLLLPVMVYAFVSGLWLIRSIAEAGLARR
jgi:hypothetical protein